ncbi:MAG: polysaccharide pyruvyl transferase family protein [Cyanobacteria bacterium J06633_2]
MTSIAPSGANVSIWSRLPSSYPGVLPMFAIHGAYYDNNFGDLLLMRIFENWVRSAFSSSIVYPLLPKSEYNRFGHLFPNTQFGMKSWNQWQGLLYAGGGHFGEPHRQARKGYRGYRSWSLRFFLRHVMPAELCIRRQVPYLIAGVGVGPLTNPMVRQEVKRIFNHADTISVRNAESQRYVQESLGIKDVRIVPDAALTLTQEEILPEAMERVEQLFAPYGDRPLLGIHHPRYILADTPQAIALRTELIRVLKTAPEVVPVIFADDGGGKFSEPCDTLARLIQEETGRSCLTVPFKGVWQTIALISKLSAVITTKLHVAIVAYAMGVYAESCAVHPKVKRFFEQIGRSSQCTLIHDLTEAIAQEKMQRVVQVACSPVDIKDATWAQTKQQALVNKEIVSTFVKTQLR